MPLRGRPAVQRPEPDRGRRWAGHPHRRRPGPLAPGAHKLAVKVGDTPVEVGQTLRLRAAAKKLSVRLGDAELTGNAFTITRGGRTALRVALLPVPERGGAATTGGAKSPAPVAAGPLDRLDPK